MPDLLRFIVHPPERRSRGVIIAGGCCTTCCCCTCCLHSLGGILGAAGVQAPAEATAWTGYARAQKVYWHTVWIGTVLSVLLVAVTKGPWWAAGLLFFGTPLVQLLASVVALLLILRQDMHPTDRAAAKKAIGRITLRTIVGTLKGLFVMSPVLLLLSGLLR
jgi:hypothetical protein